MFARVPAYGSKWVKHGQTFGPRKAQSSAYFTTNHPHDVYPILPLIQNGYRLGVPHHILVQRHEEQPVEVGAAHGLS